MVLTDMQRQDLHQSMLDYLIGMGECFAETAATFEREAGVSRSEDGRHAGLLEKKWTSVIRLQRKVMELETKLKQVEESAKLGGVVSRRDVLGRARARPEFLPQAPPSYSLSGHRSPITCVAFHPVFSIFVSGSEDATVKVWDFETGEFERTLKGHTNHVQCVVFNASGSLLASASADLTLKIWDFSSDGEYECLKTLRGHDHNVCGVAFPPSADTDRLYSCSRDHTIKIWEISTGYCLNTLNNGHADWIRDIAVSDDGSLLASCGNDRSILLWDLQHMRVVQALREHEHVVESVVFARSGVEEQAIEKIYSGRLNGTTESSDVHTNGSSDASANDDSLSPTPAPTAIASTLGTRKLKFLLSGSRDCSVRLWEGFSGTMLMQLSAHENWVRCVRFHPCGGYAISVAEDKTIRVFDLESGRCVRTVNDAHGHFITCLDVHATLPLMVTGGIDKMVNVWDCS